MPQHLQAALNKHALWDLLKEQAKESIVAHQVDFVELSEQFVLRKAKNTQISYKIGLSLFFSHCRTIGIHPLTIKPDQVDQWIDILSDELQPNSVRTRVFAVSSFFRHLKRYRYISHNPFLGATVPTKKYKYANTDFQLTQCEFDKIMSFIDGLLSINPHTQAQKNKLESLRMLKSALLILRHYGIRVGALDSIKLNGDHFIAITKGGKITKHFVDIDTQAFSYKFKKNTVQKAFFRLCAHLHKAGVIKKVYNCHDIRHLFAFEYYSQTKDIVGLKNKLTHSSLHVTDIYLQHLNL